MLSDSKQIVLLQIRDTPDAIERELQAVLRTSQMPQDLLRPVDVLAGDDLLAALAGARALIIGGAKYSVFEDMPRLADLIEVVVQARERGLPMFGICFGIQLIAHAFGGRVVRDEENRERGTFDVWLTNAGHEDPLFGGLPNSFPVQCSHHDVITELPEDARLLASSARCRVQALVMPGRIYGVQFHPERTRAEMEKIFAAQTDELTNARNAPSPGGAPLRESPTAASVLRRFIEMIT